MAPILATYVNQLFHDAEQALLKKLERVTVARMDRHVRKQILEAMKARRSGFSTSGASSILFPAR